MAELLGHELQEVFKLWFTEFDHIVALVQDDKSRRITFLQLVHACCKGLLPIAGSSRALDSHQSSEDNKCGNVVNVKMNGAQRGLM